MFNQLLDSFQRQVLPDRTTLRELIRDPASRARLLAHIPLRTYLANIATLRSGIDCATVDVEMAAFIDAERAGDDVQTIYEDVVVHLSQCPDCYERYMLVRATIETLEGDDAPAWALAVPPPTPPMPPMMTAIVARHEFRRAADIRARRAAMRGTRDTEHVLYNGALPERPGAFVEVTLRSGTPPARWNILVAVSGTIGGADRTVRLKCGLETRFMQTDANGEAIFDDIPDAWVVGDDVPDLEVGVAVY